MFTLAPPHTGGGTLTAATWTGSYSVISIIPNTTCNNYTQNSMSLVYHFEKH